jgi:hypothetical protein
VIVRGLERNMGWTDLDQDKNNPRVVVHMLINFQVP